MDKNAQLKDLYDKFTDKTDQLTEFYDKYEDKNNFPDGFNDSLAKVVDSFVASDVIEIISSPKKYPYGMELKENYIEHLTSLYKISCATRNFVTGNKIFNILYEIFEQDSSSIESSRILDAYIQHLYSTDSSNEDKSTTRKLFNILDYMLDVNFRTLAKLKSSSEGKENESIIASIPKLIKAVVLYGDKSRPYNENEISYIRSLLKSVVMKEKYGKFVAQLFSNEYAKIRHQFAEKTIGDFLRKGEMKKFLGYLNYAETTSAVMKYITAYRHPYEIGCYIMKSRETPKDIYEILQLPEMDARLRIYALRVLSKMESDEGELMFTINNSKQIGDSLLRMMGSSDAKANRAEFDRLNELRDESKGLSIITDAQRKELSEAAGSILKGKIYLNRKNPFSNNIDAELILTALVLRSSEIADVDIIKSLYAMPDVLSFNSNQGKLLIIEPGKQEIIGRKDTGFILQDVSQGAKADEREIIELFIDTIDSFIVFINEDGLNAESIKAEIKKQLWNK